MKLTLALLTVASLASTISAALKANENERAICEAQTNGRTLDDATKDRRLSCQVVCDYEDENGNEQREMYNSPDDQQCDDLEGGGATGTCKDGKCAPGGVE